jgi:lipid A 4'-phosphatase
MGRILALCAAIAACFLLFALVPWIDLRVTGALQSADGSFAATSGWPEAMRLGVWRLSEVMLVTGIAALVLGLWSGGPVLGLSGRVSGFVVALYLLGPGLVVDGILKRFWGRARPADVTEFGGLQRFTPPHAITDQCSRNCSFVSGEVAGAVALCIALLVIRRALGGSLRPWISRLWLCGALALPVLVAAQRIAAGRHFLSDAILAALIVLLIAALLSRLFFRAGTR